MHTDRTRRHTAGLTSASLHSAAALALSLALAGAPAALARGPAAQDPGANAPAASPPGGQGPGGSLSGPRVEPAAQRATLVRRDLAGKVVQLDEAPAEVALRVMKLDEPTRAKVDALLAERARALDEVVEQNLLVIADLAGLAQSGQHEKAAAKTREFYAAHEALRRRSMLTQEANKLLSEADQQELRRLVQEYIQARIKDAQDQAEAAGKAREFRPGSVARADMAHVIGKDIGRSYERVFGQKAADFAALQDRLNLTDQQRAAWSRAAQSLLPTGNGPAGQPSKAAHAKVVAELFAGLTPEQRKLALEELKPAAKPAPTPAPATPAGPGSAKP